MDLLEQVAAEKAKAAAEREQREAAENMAEGLAQQLQVSRRAHRPGRVLSVALGGAAAAGIRAALTAMRLLPTQPRASAAWATPQEVAVLAPYNQLAPDAAAAAQARSLLKVKQEAREARARGDCYQNRMEVRGGLAGM